ncbi:hypothetical protein, partial [Brevibacterium sp. FAM 24630]|uniref:hypothetical protein n=1 Tax=Brevibacterium sp. FAM 24630 TaxID=3415680 RepID=UPI003C7DC0D1
QETDPAPAQSLAVGDGVLPVMAIGVGTTPDNVDLTNSPLKGGCPYGFRQGVTKISSNSLAG